MKSLNLIVCVKPVPDTRYWSKITLDPKTKTLRRQGIPIIIGPNDLCALEEALRAKEKFGGKVTVISMGPPNTNEILEWSIVLGADEAVLLTDRAFAGADTWATAYALAKGIEKLGSYDIILVGNASLDGSTAQVGPQIAEFLKVSHISRVSKIEFINHKLRVNSKFEGGFMVMEAPLPAVVAVEREINEPRFPPLLGAIWAAERQIKIYSAEGIGADKSSIGLSGSPTQVADVFTVEMKRKGKILSGEPSQVAKQLVDELCLLELL
jgi:electron transfer flavoprotein beta subunit